MNASPSPSDALLALFTAQSHDHALILMDARGTIVNWLGGAEDILGWRRDEALGRNLAFIFTPEDVDRGLSQYELEVAAADSRSEDDRWHVRKDGTRIWLTGSVVPLHDAAGMLAGFAKVVRDRTDLRTQIEVLENRSTAQQQELDRVQRYVAALGHEMRNPLGALANAVTLIERTGDAATVQRALQIVRRQQQVLARFSDDLTDLARLETGKLRLDLQRTDLRALLADAAQSMGQRAATAGVALQPLLPGASVWARADPARIQQVVLNLIENAIKYTPAGGRVWLKVTEEGPDAVLRVEDTGIGIAPDMLPRIFELFTQDGGAAAAVPGGLGIGLAVVRDLVELHGGEALVRSSGLGKGSEFTVRLPVAGPCAPETIA